MTNKLYKPETPFQIEEEYDDFIYNLRYSKKAMRSIPLENDVYISVQADHLKPEIKREICEVIKDALNKNFFKKEKENG